MSRIPVRTPSRSGQHENNGNTQERIPQYTVYGRKSTNIDAKAAAKTADLQTFKTPSKPRRVDVHATTTTKKAPATSTQRTDKTILVPLHSEQRVNKESYVTQRPATAQKSQPPRQPELHKAKSSIGLREHIARARAELQKSAKKPPPSTPIPSTNPRSRTTHDSQLPIDPLDDPFSTIKDPFNQEKNKPKVDPRVQDAIRRARKDGRLNIASMELCRIPRDVIEMYRPEPSHVIDFSLDSGPSWYDYADLTYLNAADNELEAMDDDLIDIMGGVITIDLHNNKLTMLPQSVLELSQLTTLNLSDNKFENTILDLVTLIPTLTELNLSRNKLCGILSSKISKLDQLAILDLSENAIEAIDYSLTGCKKLQKLDLSGNKLIRFSTSQISEQIDLTELDISRNTISSPFIDSTTTLSRLSILNLSHNDFSDLSATPDHKASLPSLTILSLSQNRTRNFDALLIDGHNLINLNIEGNKYSSLPTYLYALQELRHLDISDNSLDVIPHEIGFMNNLTQFRWEGNPARMRGCFGLDTAGMLQYLRSRAPTAQHQHDEQEWS